MEEILVRAMAAHYKALKAIVKHPDKPSATFSELRKVKDREFVVLRNDKAALLAVYQVRGDNGTLMRLESWPAELEARQPT
jgi:hypothetical protein